MPLKVVGFIIQDLYETVEEGVIGLPPALSCYLPGLNNFTTATLGVSV